MPSNDKNQTTNNGRLQDFGEHIKGSKKEMFAFANYDLSDSETRKLPFSKLWDKKDIEKIENHTIAAIATVLRESMPSKPRKSYYLNGWFNKLEQAQDIIRSFIDGNRVEEAQKFITTAVEKRTQMADKADLLNRIDRTDWGVIGDVYVGKRGNELALVVEINGNIKRFTASENITDYNKVAENVIEQVKSQIAISREQTQETPETSKKNQKELSFTLYQLRDPSNPEPYFYVASKDKTKHPLITFATLEEARAFRTDNYDQLVKMWNEHYNSHNIKKENMRSANNEPRVGENYRQGRDITPEEFMDTFGIRGGQFGNWVNGDERTAMLNNTYDGLMDLAKAINVPPKALGLNGTLGMAWGARGSGRANAHYEPAQTVINLTKTNGAGALAHEWFHALDNYLAGGMSFMTEQRQPKSVVDERLNEPLKALREAINSMTEKGYRGRSEKADGYRSKPYFGSMVEMTARAFESHVIAELAKQNSRSDFLANVTPEGIWLLAPDAYPYPTKIETAELAKSYSKIFETLAEVDKNFKFDVEPVRKTQLQLDTERVNQLVAEMKSNPEYADITINTRSENYYEQIEVSHNISTPTNTYLFQITASYQAGIMQDEGTRMGGFELVVGTGDGKTATKHNSIDEAVQAMQSKINDIQAPQKDTESKDVDQQSGTEPTQDTKEVNPTIELLKQFTQRQVEDYPESNIELKQFHQNDALISASVIHTGFSHEDKLVKLSINANFNEKNNPSEWMVNVNVDNSNNLGQTFKNIASRKFDSVEKAVAYYTDHLEKLGIYHKGNTIEATPEANVEPQAPQQPTVLSNKDQDARTLATFVNENPQFTVIPLVNNVSGLSVRNDTTIGDDIHSTLAVMYYDENGNHQDQWRVNYQLEKGNDTIPLTVNRYDSLDKALEALKTEYNYVQSLQRDIQADIDMGAMGDVAPNQTQQEIETNQFVELINNFHSDLHAQDKHTGINITSDLINETGYNTVTVDVKFATLEHNYDVAINAVYNTDPDAGVVGERIEKIGLVIDNENETREFEFDTPEQAMTALRDKTLDIINGKTVLDIDPNSLTQLDIERNQAFAIAQALRQENPRYEVNINTLSQPHTEQLYFDLRHRIDNENLSQLVTAQIVADYSRVEDNTHERVSSIDLIVRENGEIQLSQSFNSMGDAVNAMKTKLGEVIKDPNEPTLDGDTTLLIYDDEREAKQAIEQVRTRLPQITEMTTSIKLSNELPYALVVDGKFNTPTGEQTVTMRMVYDTDNGKRDSQWETRIYPTEGEKSPYLTESIDTAEAFAYLAEQVEAMQGTERTVPQVSYLREFTDRFNQENGANATFTHDRENRTVELSYLTQELGNPRTVTLSNSYNENYAFTQGWDVRLLDANNTEISAEKVEGIGYATMNFESLSYDIDRINKVVQPDSQMATDLTALREFAQANQNHYLSVSVYDSFNDEPKSISLSSGLSNDDYDYRASISKSYDDNGYPVNDKYEFYYEQTSNDDYHDLVQQGGGDCDSLDEAYGEMTAYLNSLNGIEVETQRINTMDSDYEKMGELIDAYKNNHDQADIHISLTNYIDMPETDKVQAIMVRTENRTDYDRTYRAYLSVQVGYDDNNNRVVGDDGMSVSVDLLNDNHEVDEHLGRFGSLDDAYSVLDAKSLELEANRADVGHDKQQVEIMGQALTNEHPSIVVDIQTHHQADVRFPDSLVASTKIGNQSFELAVKYDQQGNTVGRYDVVSRLPNGDVGNRESSLTLSRAFEKFTSKVLEAQRDTTIENQTPVMVQHEAKFRELADNFMTNHPEIVVNVETRTLEDENRHSIDVTTSVNGRNFGITATYENGELKPNRYVVTHPMDKDGIYKRPYLTIDTAFDSFARRAVQQSKAVGVDAQTAQATLDKEVMDAFVEKYRADNPQASINLQVSKFPSATHPEAIMAVAKVNDTVLLLGNNYDKDGNRANDSYVTKINPDKGREVIGFYSNLDDAIDVFNEQTLNLQSPVVETPAPALTPDTDTRTIEGDLAIIEAYVDEYRIQHPDNNLLVIPTTGEEGRIFGIDTKERISVGDNTYVIQGDSHYNQDGSLGQWNLTIIDASMGNNGFNKYEPLSLAKFDNIHDFLKARDIEADKLRMAQTIEQEAVIPDDAPTSPITKLGNSRSDQYLEQISQKLLEQIRQNQAVWQMPFQEGNVNNNVFRPVNKDGTPYRGLNAVNLAMTSVANGYQDNRWFTFNGAKDVGGSVKKGEKGTQIYFWKFPDKDEEGKKLDPDDPRRHPIFKVYTVFNAEQCNNIPEKALGFDPALMSDFERHERCEAILQASGANIIHTPIEQGYFRAFYSSKTDSITLPPKELFRSESAYYATALHELGHWTGHKDRLNRELGTGFGSYKYAIEELRAETASMFIGQELQIGHDPSDHIAYLKSWLLALENDPKEFFGAIKDADKIFQYVMQFDQEREINKEAEATIDATTQQTVVDKEPEPQPNKEGDMRVYYFNEPLAYPMNPTEIATANIDRLNSKNAVVLGRSIREQLATTNDAGLDNIETQNLEVVNNVRNRAYQNYELSDKDVKDYGSAMGYLNEIATIRADRNKDINATIDATATPTPSVDNPTQSQDMGSKPVLQQSTYQITFVNSMGDNDEFTFKTQQELDAFLANDTVREHGSLYVDGQLQSTHDRYHTAEYVANISEVIADTEKNHVQNYVNDVQSRIVDSLQKAGYEEYTVNKYAQQTIDEANITKNLARFDEKMGYLVSNSIKNDEGIGFGENLIYTNYREQNINQYNDFVANYADSIDNKQLRDVQFNADLTNVSSLEATGKTLAQAEYQVAEEFARNSRSYTPTMAVDVTTTRSQDNFEQIYNIDLDATFNAENTDYSVKATAEYNAQGERVGDWNVAVVDTTNNKEISSQNYESLAYAMTAVNNGINEIKPLGHNHDYSKDTTATIEATASQSVDVTDLANFKPPVPSGKLVEHNEQSDKGENFAKVIIARWSLDDKDKTVVHHSLHNLEDLEKGSFEYVSDFSNDGVKKYTDLKAIEYGLIEPTPEYIEFKQAQADYAKARAEIIAQNGVEAELQILDNEGSQVKNNVQDFIKVMADKGLEGTVQQSEQRESLVVINFQKADTKEPTDIHVALTKDNGNVHIYNDSLSKGSLPFNNHFKAVFDIGEFDESLNHAIENDAKYKAIIEPTSPYNEAKEKITTALTQAGYDEKTIASFDSYFDARIDHYVKVGNQDNAPAQFGKYVTEKLAKGSDTGFDSYNRWSGEQAKENVGKYIKFVSDYTQATDNPTLKTEAFTALPPYNYLKDLGFNPQAPDDFIGKGQQPVTPENQKQEADIQMLGLPTSVIEKPIETAVTPEPQTQTPPAQNEPVALGVAEANTRLYTTYTQKDEVKALGAKWDNDNRYWYAPKGEDLAKFANFLNEPNQAKSYSKPSANLTPEFDTNKAIADFATFLENNGVELPSGHPKDDGQYHRVKGASDSKSYKKSGAYVLHTDGIPRGTYYNHKDGVEVKWQANIQDASNFVDAEAARITREARQAQIDAQRKEVANKASEIAKGIMSVAVDADANHPYLKNKGISSVGIKAIPSMDALPENLKDRVVIANDWKQAKDIRQAHTQIKEQYQAEGKPTPELPVVLTKGDLVFPIQNIEGEIRSLQTISGAKGFKAYLKDGEKEGNFCVFGEPKDGQPLAVGEGASTCKTFNEVTNLPTIVAFDKGNLDVAKLFHEKMPNSRIYIVADNDFETERDAVAQGKDNSRGQQNGGIYEAKRVASEIGDKAYVLIPQFDQDKDVGCSDWNDLCVKKGISEVRSQVREQVNQARASELQQATPAPAQEQSLGVPSVQPQVVAQPQPQPTAQKSSGMDR